MQAKCWHCMYNIGLTALKIDSTCANDLHKTKFLFWKHGTEMQTLAKGDWLRQRRPTAWNCHLHPSLRFSGSSNHYDSRIFGTRLNAEFVSSKITALGYATQRPTFVFASAGFGCQRLLRQWRHLASIKVRYTSHLWGKAFHSLGEATANAASPALPRVLGTTRALLLEERGQRVG